MEHSTVLSQLIHKSIGGNEEKAQQSNCNNCLPFQRQRERNVINPRTLVIKLKAEFKGYIPNVTHGRHGNVLGRSLG